VSYLKYYLIFNGVFFLTQILIGLAGYLLEFDFGTGASIGAVMAGCIIAGRSFCIDHGRLPATNEKWRLAIGSLLVNLAISLAVVAAALAFSQSARLLAAEIIEGVGLIPLGLILIVVTALYLGVMYFSFGFLLSKVMAKSLSAEGHD